jgi:hypothetical protein
MMTELICAYYRRTKLGGVDEPVGYKRVGNMLVEVEPAMMELSKSGRHGRYCWRKNDIDLVVIYGMTNSGKCYVEVMGQLDKEIIEKIKEIIEKKWCIERKIVTTII